MNHEIRFPNPHLLPRGADGLIYIGGDLSVRNLHNAYSAGIFPWPLEPEYPIFWFCPDERGVLDFRELHVPASLEKLRRKSTYRFTLDTCFETVIRACAKQPRKGQSGTWIVPQMVDAYIGFHKAGYAHSIECWHGERLVGGLYGVMVKGVFSGESMYHLEPNVSKLCLVEMVKHLQSRGLTWMDIQMTTPVTEQLGGKYISREDFLKRLELAQKKSKAIKFA